MSRSWAGGSTAEWRKARRRVLAANLAEHGGKCQLNVGHACPKHGKACPDVCTGTATEVHHERGKAYGDDRRHLVPACRACNLHVGNPQRFNPQPRPRSRW